MRYAKSGVGRPRYLITTAELSRLTGRPGDKTHVFIKQLEEKAGQKVVSLPGNKFGAPSGLARLFLETAGVDYSFKVLSIINLKGGVGKTTSAISLATRAVQYGFKTCILDMDSQGSATLAFDVEPAEDDPIFCDIWQHPETMVMGSLKAIEDNLYILPSALENGLLDSILVSPVSQKNAVRGVCKVLQNNGFDLVVIDCPPSLGTAVISSSCASDIIVVPVCSDSFSLKGLALTISEIASIRETFNLGSPELKVLYTKFDRRLKASFDAARILLANYKEMLVPLPIRTSSRFARALQNRETVFASHQTCASRGDYDRCFRHLMGFDNIFKISRKQKILDRKATEKREKK
ncbi:MAG: ParA family protein [Desulfobacterales bacterium]|nr:ParA family protein [Desulfobacterales bacterium]